MNQTVPFDDPRVLRLSADLLLVEDWALVLESQGLPQRVEPRDELWALIVAAGSEARAQEVLARWDAENAPEPLPAAEPDYGPSLLGPLLALLLLGAFLLTGERDDSATFFARGSADAAAILRGAWWRCATALTLHADVEHVGGNAFTGGALIAALARRLGPGAAAWIALLAGALGNVLTALVWRRHFTSVGASTAVFGLVGALAGVQFAAKTAGRARRFLSLGAALALLAMLGTSEHADLLAHLFGLACGLALGAVAVRALPEPPQRSPLQPALSALALTAVLGCWLLALR
ncbi:MAG: rhomboid family intramembrane serine protease [Myxococcales bacterium]